MQKPIGTCPFCDEKTRAVVTESNNLRRDKCQCENCKETIYVCRTPACHDYAKGGDIYDDEFCPACIRSIPGNIGSLVGFVGTVVSLSAILKKK